MEIVFAVGTVVRLAIRLFVLLLWGRLILDWVSVLVRGFRPRGLLLVVAEAVYTVTDPPLRMFRKFLPPIRLGQISLDLGWFFTLIACYILLGIVPGMF